MRKVVVLFFVVVARVAIAVTSEAVRHVISTTESNRDFVLPTDSRFQRKWANFVSAVSSYSQGHDISQAFALVDCTIMGGGEDGMLIDPLGITIHNDELSSGSNGFISWADLASSGQVVAEGQYNVSVCLSPHISISVAGSNFSQEQMVVLVSKLISAAKVQPLTKEDNLLSAISARNPELVMNVIRSGFGSLNCELAGHWSPMSRAAALNAVNIMRLLKEYGATIDYCIPGYWDNLQTACNNKAYDAVRYLVGECQMPIGNNLVEAAQNGDLWLVKYFVSECHADGAKALDAARGKNQQAIVDWLDPVVRESAALVKASFEKQLMDAIRAKDAASVASLVNGTKYSLNFEEKNGNNTWTPLTYAASIGNIEIIGFLIDAGADVRHVDSVKNTPIDQAAWSGQLETVKYLSRYDNDLGCAALAAVMNGNLAVIEWMIEEKGISPNYVNHDTSKACIGVLLAEAANRGKLEVCRYLISKGATVDYHPRTPRGGYRYSALERAAQNGQLNVLRFLAEEHNAKLYDALDLAKKNKHQDVVTYLESQYAGELKARKEAAEALARAKAEIERKRKAEEEARARVLAAQKEADEKVCALFEMFTNNEDFRYTSTGAVIMKKIMGQDGMTPQNIKNELLPCGNLITEFEDALLKKEDLALAVRASKRLDSALRYKECPKKSEEAKSAWRKIQSKAAQLRDTMIELRQAKDNADETENAVLATALLGVFASDDIASLFRGGQAIMNSSNAINRDLRNLAQRFETSYESFREACVDFMVISE